MKAGHNAVKMAVSRGFSWLRPNPMPGDGIVRVPVMFAVRKALPAELTEQPGRPGLR